MSKCVNLEVLTKWQDTLNKKNVNSDQEIDSNIGTSPFLFNKNLNKRIIYWVGNIWLLKADAIVCCVGEDSKKDLITQHTIRQAGPDYKLEYKKCVEKCKNSDTKVTKGYYLPSSCIIHTTPPKYSPKYFTGSEISLHNAYKSVLAAAEENNFSSLGIRCIHSSVHMYPPTSGAHVALRTVRRFLEQHSMPQTVVFVVSNHNKEAYDSLLPLYFPRSEYEEKIAVMKLPMNTGNQEGQLYLPERQIRIKARPMKLKEENDFSSLHSSPFDTKRLVIDASFMAATDNVDKERVKKIQRGEQQLLNDATMKGVLYQRLLMRARKEDFKDLINKKFLYQSGFDKTGQPLMVFLAQRWVDDELFIIQRRASNSNLSPAQILRERLKLFFIHQMHIVVKEKYSFLYVHNLTNKTQPSPECLRDLLKILDPQYLTNLTHLYILHSTSIFARLNTLYQHPTCLNNKTIFLKGLEHLWTFVSPDQLDLPESVMANDLHLHGVRYFY